MAQALDRDLLFVEPGRRMTPNDAVAALITVDGGYLMQHRDAVPGIFYPGHWGLFGGGVEPGESETEALARELSLEIGRETMARFTNLTFDFTFAGGPRSIYRAFYELAFPSARLEAIHLREGRRWAILTAQEALDLSRPTIPMRCGCM